MTGIALPVVPAPGAAPKPGQIAAALTGKWHVSPLARWIDPDYTGFYESDHNSGGPYAGLLVQVNQAGQILAGWAVPPPMPIPAAPLKCFTPGGAMAQAWSRRELALVFIADLEHRDPSDGTVPVLAMKVALVRSYRPSDLWFHSADPTLVIERMRDGVRPERGSLKLGSVMQPSLQIKFEPGAPGFEPLNQLSDQPRMPAFHGAWSASKGVGEQPFSAWATTHSRPLPVGYLDDSAAALAPDSTAPWRKGHVDSPLSKAIRDWYAAPKQLRGVRRETLFTLLLSWVKTTTPHPEKAYAGRTRAALLAALSLHTVTIANAQGADVTRSYREWIEAAYAEEVAKWVKNGRREHDPFVPAISGLGISQGSYLYTFTFATGDALPLPSLVKGKIPEPGKFLRLGWAGATIGFNPFYMNVRMEEVTVKTDSEGQPVIDKDGKIVCEKADLCFDTAGDYLSGLIGGYFDAGLGFPKAGVDLKSVQILCGHKDLTKDSFDGAYFSIGQAKSPSAGNSVYSVQGPRSVMFSVWKDSAAESFDLMTVVKIPASRTPMKGTSNWDFFKPLLDPSKVIKPNWTVATFGMGIGMLVSGGRSTTTHRVAETVKQPVPNAELTMTPEIDNFFQFDSNKISAQPKPGSLLSPRAVLETALAQERMILINPHAEREVTGWTSPEGPAPYNLELSKARARALAQAVQDAFKSPMVRPLADAEISGLGEEPSLARPAFANQTRLQDPETVLNMTSQDPAFAAAYAKFKREHPEQVRAWPDWRKAQLKVSGQAIISVGGPQAP